MLDTLLANRYQIRAELGRGGMGTVYRAWDTHLERSVAVKVLSNQGIDSIGRGHLLHEARATAGLNHSNIVTLYDATEHESMPFIVMELIEGQPLSQWQPADLSQVLDIAIQICQALEHAHRLGIIHRDIKPANILLVQSEVRPSGWHVKLMDFGLARSMASRMSTEGGFAGTVHYIAPEQAMGQEVDRRADLYALGVILYKLSTNELPFQSDDPIAVITQHLFAPVVPPYLKNEQISPELNALIVELLAKQPADRPADATAVRHRLYAMLHPRAAPAPVPPVEPELSMLERIVRGRLVGREDELGEARRAWKRAQHGEGQVLLISGEPGIGKSRLVREMITTAEVSGGMALIGESYEEGGMLFDPFGQIAQRALQSARPDGLVDLTLADLLSIAPGLSMHFPDLPPNPRLDPQSEQQRLFESVITFCHLLSQQKPLLLVFEDIHWADSATLSLLRQLARRSRSQRLMLVATYREVEVDQARPLQNFLLDIQRDRLAQRIKLNRLDVDATRQMLATLFSESITEEFLQGIYRETEGNPFFIEEVVKSLVEDGKLYFENGEWRRPPMEELHIPQSVRVAIQSRLMRLDEALRDLLEMAAILGREFDFDTLLAASGQDEALCFDALEKAERAQLILETSSARGGTFQFAHALIPATLVEGLSGLRRRRMHRQALEAIEGLRPDDFERLAYHATESGSQARALHFLRRAAERAYARHVIPESLRYWEQAAELADALGEQEQLYEIHRQLGGMHPVLDAGRGHFQQALELARTPRQRGEVLAGLGLLLAGWGDIDCREVLNQALTFLDPQSDQTLIAQVHAGLGRYAHLMGDYREALHCYELGLQVAGPEIPPYLSNTLHIYLSASHAQLAHYTESNHWAEQVLAAGKSVNDPHWVCLAHEFISENCINMGEIARGLEHAGQNRQVGLQAGILVRAAWADFAKAHLLNLAGRMREALAAAQSSIEMAQRIGERRLEALITSLQAGILAELGDVQPAGEILAALEKRPDVQEQIFVRFTLGMFQVQYLLVCGENEAAHSRALAQQAEIEASQNRQFFGLNARGLLEALARCSDEPGLERFGRQLLELGQQAPSGLFQAMAWQGLGIAAGLRQDWEAAGRGFITARQLASELGCHKLVADNCFHTGLMRLRAGQPDEARLALQEAQALYTQFEMAPAAQRCAEVMLPID